MRPRIAVDIDGVLADIHTAVFRRLGLNLRAEDIRVWDFFEELGLERRVFWDAYRELWSRDYRSIPLIEESAPPDHRRAQGEIRGGYSLVQADGYVGWDCRVAEVARHRIRRPPPTPAKSREDGA